MDIFGKRMTFEQERIADEKGVEFEQRVETHLEALDRDASPQEILAAINAAGAEMDPDHGELVYEMDDQ